MSMVSRDNSWFDAGWSYYVDDVVKGAKTTSGSLVAEFVK